MKSKPHSRRPSSFGVMVFELRSSELGLQLGNLCCCTGFYWRQVQFTGDICGRLAERVIRDHFVTTSQNNLECMSSLPCHHRQPCAFSSVLYRKLTCVTVSLVPRLLPSFLSYTVFFVQYATKKLGRSLGTRQSHDCGLVARAGYLK